MDNKKLIIKNPASMLFASEEFKDCLCNNPIDQQPPFSGVYMKMYVILPTPLGWCDFIKTQLEWNNNEKNKNNGKQEKVDNK